MRALSAALSILPFRVFVTTAMKIAAVSCVRPPFRLQFSQSTALVLPRRRVRRLIASCHVHRAACNGNFSHQRRAVLPLENFVYFLFFFFCFGSCCLSVVRL